MFVITLKFARNAEQASEWMQGHNAWLAQGFDDGVFMLSGSLKPGPGGGILATGVTLDEIERRVQDDPFVREGVVSADIIELIPGKVDARLSFLQN